MANKALNQVSQVQSIELANVKTFLAVMNNGEIKQMSKEDMAAVVGELIGIASQDKDGLARKGSASMWFSAINSGEYIQLNIEAGAIIVVWSNMIGGSAIYLTEAKGASLAFTARTDVYGNQEDSRIAFLYDTDLNSFVLKSNLSYSSNFRVTVLPGLV